MEIPESEIIHQELPSNLVPSNLIPSNLIPSIKPLQLHPPVLRELTGLYPDVEGLALSLAPRVHVVGQALKKYDSFCDEHWYIIDLRALADHRKMLHEYVNACYVELEHCQQLLAIDRLAKYDPIYKSYFKKVRFLTSKLQEVVSTHKETLTDHIRLEIMTTAGIESIKVENHTLVEYLTEVIEKLSAPKRGSNFKSRLLTGRRDDIVFLEELLDKLRNLQLVFSTFYTCEDDFATSRVPFPSPHSTPEYTTECCSIL